VSDTAGAMAPTGATDGAVRAAVGMGALTAVSRAVGFLRVLVVAAVLGVGTLGDAFQSANTLSNVLFELLAAGALSAVLVPTFVDLLDAGDDDGAEEVAGRVLGLSLIVLGAVTVGGIVGAPLIARLLTAGDTGADAADQRELVTFLLRFFLPQVVLYAAGTVASGVLFAKRRFLATAGAPIGNTVVMVGALVAFAALAGPDPTLDLSDGERWLLVVAGTGGVVAFVGILLAACARTGFRLRPRWPSRDPRALAVARSAGWGVVLHSCAGAILGGVIVAGSGVDGAVIAFQSAWVFFLAPYGILAQPIHTTMLPELVAEARDADRTRFRASVRWALERMSLAVLPVAVALVGLAAPIMRIVSSVLDEAGADRLLATALATLAIGLLPYSAFLLLARAYYALGDSRTPGLVAFLVAATGLLVLAVGSPLVDGDAQVALMGLAHTVAYTVGAVVLLVGLGRRAGGAVAGGPVVAMVVVAALVAAGLRGAAALLLDADAGVVADLVGTAALLAAGAAVLAAAYRASGLGRRLTARRPDPVVP